MMVTLAFPGSGDFDRIRLPDRRAFEGASPAPSLSYDRGDAEALGLSPRHGFVIGGREDRPLGGGHAGHVR